MQGESYIQRAQRELQEKRNKVLELFNTYKKISMIPNMSIEFDVENAKLKQWAVNSAGYITYPVEHMLGRVYDLVNCTQEEFNNIAHWAATGTKLDQAEKQERLMAQTLQEQLEEAKQKGELWGDFIVAVCPSIPEFILYQATLEMARLYGFRDLEVGNAFMYCISQKVQTHRQANERSSMKNAISEHSKYVEQTFEG